MNAAELRVIAEAMNWHIGQTFTPGHKETFAAAAEILELLAWAEENKVEAVRRRHGYSVHVGLVAHNSDTLIDTLRRAREVAR